MSQACGNCCFCPSLVEPLTELHWSCLESLLRKNQAPSDTEKQTLAKVEQDIDEYDLAIARLQSAIATLKSRRDAAKDYVSRYKSLLAPIHQLSNDVLVEIFSYLCSDTALDTQTGFTSLPQLYLCLVCKRWRSLVNDSPLLWSTLAFSTSSYPTYQDPIHVTTLLNLANLLLNRSGSCPLTITLDDYRDVHPVSALLLQHADRWLSASVLGCNQRFLSLSSFPRLKHLDFSFGLGDTELKTTPAMPSLESLAISRLAHRPLPNFPWSQLRKLMLSRLFLSHYAFIVSRCIQLQHLTLNYWLFNCDSLPPVSIVSQTIISLTLKCIGKEKCEKLFPLLQFPQLHVLELDQCHLPPGSTYPFIAHSLSITNLSLKDLEFSLEDLLTLFRLLPTVTHFSFYHHWWEGTLEGFLSHLHHAQTPESRTLLPRLTHMEMQLNFYNDKEGPATSDFVEVVKSRVAGNQLKSVRFSVLTHCLNHDLISSLAYLPKVGVAISIRDKCGRIL